MTPRELRFAMELETGMVHLNGPTLLTKWLRPSVALRITVRAGKVDAAPSKK